MTMLMKDVEEERQILKLQQDRIEEEAKTNPDVKLSPRSMALKCVGKVTDFKALFKEYVKKEEWMTDHMEDEIDYAMTRQEILGIPRFKQDFAFRLVKLNQVDSVMWQTDFIKKVFQMVKDLEHIEHDSQGTGRTSAQNNAE